MFRVSFLAEPATASMLLAFLTTSTRGWSAVSITTRTRSSSLSRRTSGRRERCWRGGAMMDWSRGVAAPPMRGVGGAAGMERLALLIDEPPAGLRPIALLPLGGAAELVAQKLGEELRDAGLIAELTYSGNLQRRMRRADRIGARAAVLLGEDELAQNAATVRDLDSGEQSLVPLGELTARLKAM